MKKLKAQTEQRWASIAALSAAAIAAAAPAEAAVITSTTGFPLYVGFDANGLDFSMAQASNQHVGG